MTVIEMVEKYLHENGYDGLVSQYAECGCVIGDLAPCGEINEKCAAGYKVTCTNACDHDRIGNADDWHIQEAKP